MFPRPDDMQARVRTVRSQPILFIGVLCVSSAFLLPVMTSTSCSSTTSVSDEFVRHSVSAQRILGERVKQANKRTVYLFDASGFTDDFQDQLTLDNIRYKTGVLNGIQVDAVLSVSAQQTVSGEEGAAMFSTWVGPDPDLHVDKFGVYI